MGGGTVEIEGLKHGGRYWITDETSSAVGALIPKDILRNEQIEPTDPGGVTLGTVEGGTARDIRTRTVFRLSL